VGLGGGGLVLDCAVQTRGFFGKLTTREKTGVFIAFGEVLTQKSASVDTRTRQKKASSWVGLGFGFEFGVGGWLEMLR
jgi:hypothetical protein